MRLAIYERKRSCCKLNKSVILIVKIREKAIKQNKKA